MPDPADLVTVGRIRRAHGVLGVVVVEPLTEDAEIVFAAGRELVAGNAKGEPLAPERRLRIEMAEPFKDGFRVQFSGIAGRDEADRWRERFLLAPRAELPEPAADQVYLHDLVGFSVEQDHGEPVGTVEAWYELRHDIMIEVRRAADSVMIPYRFVTSVDLELRKLTVDPPVGLL